MIQIHSLVNRYYDPTTGQFISVDPLVDQTGQAYAYTGGDPVNGVDPLGLSALGNLGSFFAGVLDPITSAAAWFYNKIGESQIADLFKTIDQPFDCSPGAQESFKAGQATGATAAVAVPFVGEGTGLAGVAEEGAGGGDVALPIVEGAAPKIADLASRYGSGIENDVLTNGMRYTDAANGGNINVFMERPDASGFIRVTLDPSGQRIISAGLNTVSNVTNGIANGRFIPNP